MKKKIALLCVGAITLTMFSACGQTNVTDSTIELKKDGKVTEYVVEDFSESYYDAEEFKNFVEADVAEYLEGSDASIKVSGTEVEEQTARLTVKYDSLDTYSDFNQIECFSGSVAQAQAAGYDFATDFIAFDAEANEAQGSTDEAEAAALVTADVATQDGELNVLIIRDNADLIVPGTIVYVSAEHTAILDDKTVKVSMDDAQTDTDVLIYVLYKTK